MSISAVPDIPAAMPSNKLCKFTRLITIAASARSTQPAAKMQKQPRDEPACEKLLAAFPRQLDRVAAFGTTSLARQAAKVVFAAGAHKPHVFV
jgi:hypothetical protein